MIVRDKAAYKNILLTGASGRLGQAILNSGLFSGVLSPARHILDITEPESMRIFFETNAVDGIIHCAALTDMVECEENPIKAIETNIIGTCNLLREVLRQESAQQKRIRFIYISTDAVYSGTRGDYSEEGETIPYNRYGWTKLGAECAVRMLSDYCIIRTSFFNPKGINFEESPVDAYNSKISIGQLAGAIAFLLNSDFVGTINVGSQKKSSYERFRQYKSELGKCKYESAAKGLPFILPRDISMNLEKWKKLGFNDFGSA